MASHTLTLYLGDTECSEALETQLRIEGHEPHLALSRDQLLWQLEHRDPAAVVLGDLPTLPDTLALLRELRSPAAPPGAATVPLLVLSGSAGELSELAAFEAGADDFQRASVSYLLLRARLEALIARNDRPTQRRTVTIGALEVDVTARTVSYAGEDVALSKVEFAFLAAVVVEPTRLFTKAQLLEEVWGYPDGAGVRTRTVDAHACRLRNKLARAGWRGAIVNVRGVGYRLATPDDGAAAQAPPPAIRAAG